MSNTLPASEISENLRAIAESTTLAQQVARTLQLCVRYEGEPELDALRAFVERECALVVARHHSTAQAQYIIADAMRKLALAYDVATSPQAE